MSGIPEQPEGISLIVWIAALAAGYDAGNKEKAGAVINLFMQVRSVVEGANLPQSREEIQ